MIATIIFGPLIMLCIVFIIILIKCEESSLERKTLSGFIVIVIMGATSILSTMLYDGRSIEKKDKSEYLIQKFFIEEKLKNDLSLETIKEAKEYNADVNFGNDYIHRFNIEDRSEYLIDIDSYLKEITGGQ